jgi:hypothetical protein
VTFSASSHAHGHHCTHLINLCYQSIWPVFLCIQLPLLIKEECWTQVVTGIVCTFAPLVDNHIKLWSLVMHKELSNPFWHWIHRSQKPSSFGPSLTTLSLIKRCDLGLLLGGRWWIAFNLCLTWPYENYHPIASWFSS